MCIYSALPSQHVPCDNQPELVKFDELMRKVVGSYVNVDLSDQQWLQASLPVRYSGLRVRRAAALAFSAYLASAASTRVLQDLILADSTYQRSCRRLPISLSSALAFIDGPAIAGEGRLLPSRAQSMRLTYKEPR